MLLNSLYRDVVFIMPHYSVSLKYFYSHSHIHITSLILSMSFHLILSVSAWCFKIQNSYSPFVAVSRINLSLNFSQEHSLGCLWTILNCFLYDPWWPRIYFAFNNTSVTLVLSENRALNPVCLYLTVCVSCPTVRFNLLYPALGTSQMVTFPR